MFLIVLYSRSPLYIEFSEEIPTSTQVPVKHHKLIIHIKISTPPENMSKKHELDRRKSREKNGKLEEIKN